ncbi:peptide deformylase [Candidatus Saccharibacteria bacterium]|nr:peptide deformylase [Candidatus Saccharibacteria bacterium]
MKPLKITRLGNPILRQVTKRLTKQEILSDEIQNFIKKLKFTNESKAAGVGLSANQVGRDLAISFIGIKPTPNRPDLERFEQIMFNPEIVETFGRRIGMWEACQSCGANTGGGIFGQVPRYKRIRIKWLDENAKEHDEVLEGFPAHVAQHETDHLNGKVFLDTARRDSLMMEGEYRKRIVKKGR